MKKRIFFAIAVCTSIAYTNAQVGINTTDPKTTLHVIGTNDNGAVAATDGVLVPRVNALAVNGTEDGQLVYLIADAGTFDKGFHFWNATNSAWEPITDAEAIAASAEVKRIGTDNIVSSKAGVGSNGSTVGSGSKNLVLGDDAGATMTSGNTNIFLGDRAGDKVALPGNDNVYIGRLAGQENRNSSGQNIGVGLSALNNTNGPDGTGNAGKNTLALGISSFQNSGLGDFNLGIGYFAGRNANVSLRNVLIGKSVAQGTGSLNTSMGDDNIAIGTDASRESVIEASNILLGSSVVKGGTIGSENIIVGKSNSSSIVSTGNQNTAIGNYQLRGATLGAANISVGPNVFDAATVGNHNIAIGNSSGSGITAGTGNIMFGQSVGDGQTIGSNNIAIGGLIDFHATGATASNQLNIQNIIFGTDNSGSGTDISAAGKIGIGQPTPTERLDVAGTAKANNFRQNIEATTTVDKTKGIILANANFSIPAATDYTGLTITVRNIGTAGITFNGGNRTINGVTTNTRTIPVGNTFRFTSDGTNWYIISQL